VARVSKGRRDIGREKKVTDVTYICRSPKTKVATSFYLLFVYFYVYVYVFPCFFIAFLSAS
jgi:hypothetical protein